MKAKEYQEYLSQAFRLDQKIQSKLEQVTRLRVLAIKASASIPGEPVSGLSEPSPMENAIVKMIDLEHEINADIDGLIDLKREIMGVINSVKQPEYQLLLELRYLSFLTWEVIAEKMNYSYRQIHRLHGKALQSLEEGTP